MENTITVKITAKEWPTSKYRTSEWEQSVIITRWEHDYAYDYDEEMYVITYREK